MTTYSKTLTLVGGEISALEAALKLKIEHCNVKITERAGAPYWAHRQDCEAILKKLRSTEFEMTSTNNFGRQRDHDD